jgi:hypothetical protein
VAPRSHLLAVLGVAIALVVSGVRAGDAAAGPRIHVRGSARIDAQAARDAGDLVLSGALVDDGGQALSGETVALTLAREADPRQIVSFSEDGQTARSCGGGGAFHDATDPRPMAAGGPVVLVTDEAGRFCVRVNVPRDKYVATIAWGGTQLLEGAKLDLPVDTGRQAITLRFDPEPRAVSLDKPQLAVQIIASYQENQTTHAGASLPLYVTNEKGDALGAGATNAAGALKLTIPSERLGPPGRGELRVTFNGNGDLTKSVHRAHIERQARVTLTAPDDPAAPVSPDEGIPLVVTATTKGGVPPTGSVEARIGDAVVGAAQLENGKAQLVATFAAPREGPEVEVRIRYLPSAPWLVPGEDAIVHLRVKGPSPWKQTPLVVAGLAVIVWLVVGRIKPKAKTSKSTQSPKPVILGEARVEVLRPTRDSRAGWSGRVIDAHDGVAIRGARVRIERPGFERAAVIASAFANEQGRFELRAEATDGFDELVIDGPLHAELRQPLPACGELQVALVLRKRRLLERLVAWTKRRGRPYDASPEATPGHVRRAAGNDFAMAKWADAIEKAAYGGGDVDARLEAEVDRLAPVGVGVLSPGDPGLTVRDVPPDEAPESDAQAPTLALEEDLRRPSSFPPPKQTVKGLGGTLLDPKTTLPLSPSPPKLPPKGPPGGH